MPVFKQYTESSYKWGIWKASESLEELLALLPHKEKYEEGIGKFTAVSRKLEWLAVRNPPMGADIEAAGIEICISREATAIAT